MCLQSDAWVSKPAHRGVDNVANSSCDWKLQVAHTVGEDVNVHDFCLSMWPLDQPMKAGTDSGRSWGSAFFEGVSSDSGLRRRRRLHDGLPV